MNTPDHPLDGGEQKAQPQAHVRRKRRRDVIAEAPSETTRPAPFPSPLCDMSHVFLTAEEACNAAHLHCSRATLTRYLSKYSDRIIWRNMDRGTG